MVQLVKDKLQTSSIEQYKDEERAVLAKRILSSENRISRLLEIMSADTLSSEMHLEQLKMELYRYTNDLKFKKAQSMGSIMVAAFEFITRNYKNSTVLKK